MENSPLRFLDYDMSLMLADQVRISQEDAARKYHSNNFENSNELHLNQRRHYFISKIFDEIGHLLEYTCPSHEEIITETTTVKNIVIDYFSYTLGCAEYYRLLKIHVPTWVRSRPDLVVSLPNKQTTSRYIEAIVIAHTQY